MFISSHLQRAKYGIFHFRFTVPRDLRCILGKREINVSLQTGVQSEAIRKSFELKGNTVELFKHLRNKVMPRRKLSDLNLSLPEERRKVIDADMSTNFFKLVLDL